MQPQNESGILPAGHRILVLPDEKEEMSSGGIFIPDMALEKDRLAVCEGLVIDIGPCAYAEQEVPWCAPGDRVVFRKYGGFVRPGQDGKSYRVIEDLEVWAVVKEANNE